MSYYGSALASGLAGEKTVRYVLEQLGIYSVDSTKYENIMQDIDCWITVDDQLECIGVTPGCYPLSIKRQEAGCKYHNLGFELYQQENPVSKDDLRTPEERWTKTGWYNTGVCPIYAILQGRNVRVLTKMAVQDTIQRQGWLRKRTLTEGLKSVISKTARYSDALCGYLALQDVLHLQINQYDQSQTLIGQATPNSTR